MEGPRKRRRTMRRGGLEIMPRANSSSKGDTAIKEDGCISPSQLSNVVDHIQDTGEDSTSKISSGKSSTPAALESGAISMDPPPPLPTNSIAQAINQPALNGVGNVAETGMENGLENGNGNGNGGDLDGGSEHVDDAPVLFSMTDIGEESDEPDSGELRNYTPGAYMQREEDFIRREQLGEYAFPYLRNDGERENLIRLVALRGVYSRQLPNMPKDYICRLVLNRNHRSVAIIRHDGKVLGGITYRTFPGQSFAEIAFCAVIGTEQVKGYGTRLMNHTKQYAKMNDSISRFLTYADNNAVGYFLKQGFGKEISLSREKWSGYIKDYDGGTLMEYVFHPKLPYVNLPRMIKKQRASLDRRIRQKSNSHIEHPGLPQFSSDGQRRTFVEIQDIPGVSQAGWKPPSAVPNVKIKLQEEWVSGTAENQFAFMQGVLKEVKSREEAWPFREAVDANDVPDYYDIIKDPVDLSLMEERLNGKKYYKTLDIFKADLLHMFKNCRYYNASDTVYYKLANRLEHFFLDYMEEHVKYG